MANVIPIPGKDVPTKAMDVRAYWRALGTCAKVCNALLNVTFVRGASFDKLEISEGNATLSLQDGGGASVVASVATPWQPRPSPWTGTGADPHAADRAQRFRLYDGSVNNDTPSNMTQEFVAFAGTGTGATDEASSILTIVYWQCDLSETTLGNGDYILARPEIKLAQGTRDDSLVTLVTPPVFGDDGSLPTHIIGQIVKVLWYAGGLHFLPGLSADLSITPVVTGFSGGVAGRGFFYSASS